MNFSYHILPDLNLIIECYIGDFEFKDIFECKKLEIKDPEWRDNYDVLGDIRKGKISLTSQDIENLNTYYQGNKEIIAQRKSAVLTDRPSQVVFGTLLRDYTKLKESLVIPNVFSTTEAALSWLGIDQKEGERINKVLSQLSKE